MPELRTRCMYVLAQDPKVHHDGRILTTEVRVPWEPLAPGPIGARVHVVDYDAETGTLYEPVDVGAADLVPPGDDALILGDPGFHALNAYALVMRTVARFEFALGRRVAWGFNAPQLKVVPHAFEEANAYYSPEAQSLLFGYYRDEGGLNFMCLSHDIVVHETTHALLDGVRRRFMRPSTPDQAAFHEAFADIVALLSVFSLHEVLERLIARDEDATGQVAAEQVEMEALTRSVLFGLADNMALDTDSARINALRRSVRLEPDAAILDSPEFREPHRRGEVLVAAVMRAFLHAWTERIEELRTERGRIDVRPVAEAGAQIADVLLTMAIRALDYTPPIHLRFGDYLSALVTADAEIRSAHRPRELVLHWFGLFGVSPTSGSPDGLWQPPDTPLALDGIRFASLQTDPVEMFRLVWVNRENLQLVPDAFTRVTTVRPCVRTSPEDGLPLRETVAEVVQFLEITAAELGRYGLDIPPGMAEDKQIVLEGGSTLILDEYARLKYEIHNRIPSRDDADGHDRAQKRLEYLWEHGAFDDDPPAPGAQLAVIHRLRADMPEPDAGDAW
jgi:hypothetical protein